MPDFNKVVLIGNLTRDPELRYTPGGTAVADFRIAVNRRTRDASGGRRSEATFVNVTAWGHNAEVIADRFSKSQPIFLEGRLAFDRWTDRTGQKRSKLYVILERFQFLTPRPRRDDERPRPPAHRTHHPQE